MPKIKLKESQLVEAVMKMAKKILKEEANVSGEYPWEMVRYSEDLVNGCDDVLVVSREKARSDEDFNAVMFSIEQLYNSGNLKDGEILTVKPGVAYVVLLNDRRALGKYNSMFKYNDENRARYGVALFSNRDAENE